MVYIISLVIFFAIMLSVGIYSRKHATNVDGFVLGGRSVGPWLTAFAFGTSYFSAVIFVGYAGQFGWNFGLASTWIGLGNAFIGSLLAWVVLGRRTRIMTQKLDSRTMPDFFEKRYFSKTLKIFASLIVFIFLIPYTASLYNGLSSIFQIAFPDIPYIAIIIVMAVLTGLYVVFGGYMATAINDFIQGIVMLFGIVAVVLAVLLNKGGFTAAYTALSQIPSGELNGGFTSFFGPEPLYLLVVVILTSLGTWGLPQMIGKFYSIKNEDAIKKGTIISTAFAIIVAGGCYFLGGFGRLFDSDALYRGGKLMTDSIVPSMLSELKPVIIAIVIVLVLSASMSTLSSLVLTSSSTLTLDVIVPSMNKGEKKVSEKKKITILRLFILFFIIISAVIAILKETYGFTFIAQMMGVSWGALAGAFLAPFLYGLYSRRATKASVAFCFIWGTGIEIVQLLISLRILSVSGGIPGLIFKNSLYSGAFAMVSGLILVPIVSLITPKPERKSVDEIFTCYDITVVSEITDTLG